jgi:RalA-binding protein 1
VDLVNSRDYYDIHAVAGLLKLYLRELPITVLTRERHVEFLHIVGMVFLYPPF